MAILMWAYQDMTAEQVGLALGMNKNSVDQLLYRAKLKLKTELEKGESHALE
jgi:RNA polymerase sigma-70 factor (ECF subfamily)